MAYINGKHTMVNVNVYGGIPDAPSGSVIYAVTMGLSRDCVVGTDYAAELEAFTYPENIKNGDYMIDGDSACWFQYCELEDGEASLGGVDFRVICVANPNGKSEGAMVFKGVVSELPETANEGEVYKVEKMESLGVFVNNCEFTLTPTRINFDGANMWGNVSNAIYNDWDWGNEHAPNHKFVIDGNTYLYTECNVAGAGESYFEMDGTTADVSSNITVPIGANVAVYRYYGELKAASYIYHNGGFIEL